MYKYIQLINNPVVFIALMEEIHLHEVYLIYDFLRTRFLVHAGNYNSTANEFCIVYLFKSQSGSVQKHVQNSFNSQQSGR